MASELETSSVDLNGFSSRVWKKGEGPPLGFLAGFGGLPRWIPFLDVLARERTVIVPSLPGFPGGERGHTVLDSHLDWMLAVRRLLQKARLDGADLAGSSVGASFAAEIAAIWPNVVRRLAGANSPEWPIEQTRASEAAARAFWPLGNTRLEKRLPLIEAPTLLIWGAEDRIMPRSYPDRFAAAIAGRTEITTIPGAGHLAELDKPEEVSAAILAWTR